MTERQRLSVGLVAAGIALPVLVFFCGKWWASGMPPNQDAMVEAFIAIVLSIYAGLVLLLVGFVVLIFPRQVNE